MVWSVIIIRIQSALKLVDLSFAFIGFYIDIPWVSHLKLVFSLAPQCSNVAR